MDVKEFLSNASKDELTEFLTKLQELQGFDEICNSLEALITLY